MEPPGQARDPIKKPGFAFGYAAVIRQVVRANITPKLLCAFLLPQSGMIPAKADDTETRKTGRSGRRVRLAHRKMPLIIYQSDS